MDLVRSFQKLALAAILGFFVSGCSVLNVGSPDYACPGMPSGVQCMSAREVYAATNDGQVPRPAGLQETEKNGRSSHSASASASHISGSEDEVINTYVAPNLPNKPIPIRTPAQVMRVWVAPWEDTNGDLIVTGFIYTEIEPRRWVIGRGIEESESVIRPLR